MRILAAVLALAGAATILQRPHPVPREELYRRAVTLLRDGDFANAAANAHAEWRNRPLTDWSWRFRLLEAEALIEGANPEAGLAILDAGSAVTSREFEIRRRVLTARRLLNLSNLDRANILLTDARQLAARYSRPDLLPEIDLLVAQVLGRKSRFADAEMAFDEARRSAAAQGDLFRVAVSFNGPGMLRMLGSRCDQAIPLFDSALQLWKKLGARYWIAVADVNLLMCYSVLGDFDKALAYGQQSMALVNSGTLYARALGEMGTVYLYQEESRKAIEYYRKACDTARQSGSPRDAARWAGNLAQALASAGEWDAADRALREANSLGPEPRSRIYLDLDAAGIAMGRNQLAEARAGFERIIAAKPPDAVKWEAYAGIANTWVAGGELERAEQNFEAAIHVIEGSQSDLSGSQNKITFLSRLIHFYQDYVDALMSHNEPVKALAVADSSRARVLSQRIQRPMGGATPSQLTPRQAADFTAIARRSGSVWLSYWLAPHRSFLWVTTPTEVRAYELPARERIARLVEEYRGFIEASMRDPLQVKSDAGRNLYDILISPAVPILPAGSPVIVVPDGPLNQLSFDTLPVYAGNASHYWMDDAITAIAPSFGVFHGSSGQFSSARKALIIGDPISPGPGFPTLLHAAGEIAAIGRRLATPGTRVVTREAARADAWTRLNPGDFDLIHIAAHVETNPRSPLDSAIILSPGNGFRLYARNILDVPLHADLVTLSACRSSGARTYSGEGMVGLTWAFLQAGSRSVVAGLWDVADESTSVLMDHFYGGIAAGRPPNEALRDARLALRRTAYSKPYYWGPFQCYITDIRKNIDTVRDPMDYRLTATTGGALK